MLQFVCFQGFGAIDLLGRGESAFIYHLFRVQGVLSGYTGMGDCYKPDFTLQNALKYSNSSISAVLGH